MPNVKVEDLPRPDTSTQARSSLQRRDLAGACLAHMLHDGFADQIYALLPIWQTEFGLSYAGLALIRAVYHGAMGGLQVPGIKLLGRVSSRAALFIATLVASVGYLVTALPGGFWVLCAGLLYTGVILSGGFAPILYGVLADHTSRTIGISASALTAAIVIPFVLALRPALAKSSIDG